MSRRREAELRARAEAAEADMRAWRTAALLYRRLAADGLLRLKQGYSYAQAQDLYNEALAADPSSAQEDES